MRMRDEPQVKTLIPQTALVREEGGEFVFVSDKKTSFRLTKVTLGEEFNGRRVLLDGLAPGAEIVLDGAFHLNNERRRELTQGATD
jgi:membrane fusion protein, heavy metal efflux system